MGEAGRGASDPAPRRAVEYLLHTARRRLDMEAAFLAELTEHEQIYRATTGTSAESFTIIEGGHLPRLEGYCKQVMESNLPWVIRDTAAEPKVRDLAITGKGAFGAYIGVPVAYPDGRPFGTLCCLSHTARPDLGTDAVAVMEALADMLGFHVDQLLEQEAEIGDLETYAEELAERLGENELRLEVFRHLVDASVNPTLVLHPGSFHVEYANQAAAELAGVDRSALVGPPWRHHACWDEEVMTRQLAPLGVEGARPVRYQVDPVDGAPALDVHGQRVTTEAGTAFILWTGHDVSMHQQSEQRLHRALELERHASAELRRLHGLRDAFLTAISHELRTPLTTVTGAAQTLHSGRADGDLARQLLERLLANAQRLDRLLSDLLDLNQFSHGSLRIEREPVRLDELVRSAIDEFDLGQHDLDVVLDPIEATVATVKFERIVANLVHNALVHTAPDTAIAVRLSKQGDGALLEVADDGPGIPPEERRTVFEAFRQGATVPAHRPGAGIGLSLVAAFTELHDGRVWVETGEQGRGTVFRVLVPVAGREARATSSSAERR